MRTLNTMICSIALSLLLITPAAAHELDDIQIESWAGTGDHTVLLVVDFWPYNDAADSFAFGYRFTADELTGLELLNALHDADNGLTFDHTDGFVTDFWYVTDAGTYHTGYDWPTSYWSYWLSDGFGEIWDHSVFGAPQRILYDGDTDGWLAVPGNDYDSEPVTPLLPELNPGDMNCDDFVNFDDIHPFVTALNSAEAYEALNLDCNYLNADCDGNGFVNFDDIDPFIDLLVG